jgi:6-phosphogluconolactonase
MAEPRTVICADHDALAKHVADWITDQAAAAEGRFSIALSGGSTPKLLYEMLSEPAFNHRIPWTRVHVFFGDERFVPPDSDLSNFRMAREALLDHVHIPRRNIHPMPTTGTPAEAALAYQTELATYYGRETLDMTEPLFDVMLLGLGEDGHTASLFPGTTALDESLAWVTSVTEGVPQPRITLTYPAIACSRFVAFMVEGKKKAEMVRRAQAGDRSLPSARVTAAGELIWFLDKAAASA